MTSFLSREEVLKLGFKSVGKNVLISRCAKIYGASEIVIGNNVRIDDFNVISGKITIGNYVHIAPFGGFFAGDERITIGDYTAISWRVTICSKSDDFSGKTMNNPTVPDKYKNLTNESVAIGKHVILGTASVILPGVTIGEGAAIGASALVNKSCKAWTINAGVPVKYIKDRDRGALSLSKQFEQELQE
ncbi:acyltransferase [Clostridioides sp. ES-S-0145-01]|uniref:acyltransferase n=1 Tax=Clostridioides sp. ES-S-0145-01 TaxID=2770784 RepID=UPI00146D7101|nr:acyltransferase [Clostridioides sp. ES-S-0145-01]NMS89681.1 acyltransferase [Clostridioides difficile]